MIVQRQNKSNFVRLFRWLPAKPESDREFTSSKIL
uniref:Uncharacterized protein n=1 Tax=Anguilla anguilla TaxID=7936 RepID=A0A0E9UHP8_ANGAN